MTKYLAENCNIPPSVRGADGLLKQASFGSSGDTASGAGVFGIVHLHALGGVLNVPPPYQQVAKSQAL